MGGLTFHSFIPSEKCQWAMSCYTKTNLDWRYLSLGGKKNVFSLVKIGLGPMKAVHLESLKQMWDKI